MDVPPGLGCPAKIFSGGLGIPPAPFPDFSRRPGNRGQTRDLYIQVSKIELPAQMHGTGNMLESNWHNHPQGPSSWGGGGVSTPRTPPTQLLLLYQRLELKTALKFILLQGNSPRPLGSSPGSFLIYNTAK